MAKTLRDAYVPIPGVIVPNTPRVKKKKKKNPNAVATGIGSLPGRGDTLAKLIKQGKG